MKRNLNTVYWVVITPPFPDNPPNELDVVRIKGSKVFGCSKNTGELLCEVTELTKITCFCPARSVVWYCGGEKSEFKPTKLFMSKFKPQISNGKNQTILE